LFNQPLRKFHNGILVKREGGTNQHYYAKRKEKKEAQNGNAQAQEASQKKQT
jgi:hypothetical protein